MTLPELVRKLALVQKGHLLNFARQLLWHVSRLLQTELVQCAQKGNRVGTVTLQRTNLVDLLHDAPMLDNHLFKYVESCKQVVRREGHEQYWSGATDKSSVMGWAGMQYSFFAFPDNTGIAPPPGVPI